MRPPDNWQRAPATVAIAIVTAACWLAVAIPGWTPVVAHWGGFTPARIADARDAAALLPLLLTPLTATLIHAGIFHLVFNLIIHLYCGRAVEAVLGTPALLLLYAIGAYAAAAAQYAAGPHVAEPMVGASGAISALIGAYAMLFGRNRVKIANAGTATFINALWVLTAWVVLQYLAGFIFQAMRLEIAIAAHVGGFVAGLLLARPLLLWRWRGA